MTNLEKHVEKYCETYLVAMTTVGLGLGFYLGLI